MLQVLHLCYASILANQSPAVGGAYKHADQSEKFHSAAAAAGKVADAEAKFHHSRLSRRPVECVSEST